MNLNEHVAHFAGHAETRQNSLKIRQKSENLQNNPYMLAYMGFFM